MIEKSFIIGSSMFIIIGIILLYVAYNFYNKDLNKEYSQNPVEKRDKEQEEKMYKFLGKILGFFGIICVGFPIFIYYIETHPTTTTTTKPNTRTSYSNTTTNGLLKLFF